MKKLKSIIDPFLTPVGWVNRLYVFLGTACILLQRTWTMTEVYVLVWWVIYLLLLANVYHRGRRSAFRETVRQDLNDIHEAMEMHLNRRLVALDDLAQLCMKYGIPPEEVKPIIERGYGMKVIWDDDEA